MAETTNESAVSTQVSAYQETKRQRSLEQSRVREQLGIDSWQFSISGQVKKVKLDYAVKPLLLQAIVNRDSEISNSLEALHTTRQLVTDPSMNETISQVLRLEPEDYHRNLNEQFKKGEISFVPNEQLNLRPLTIVDLVYRLKDAASEAPRTLHEWEVYWKQPVTGERLERFLGLILDTGYVNGDPVTRGDRTKIHTRLKELTASSLAKQHDTDLKNKHLAERASHQIDISPRTLFHETDFSSLAQLFQTGIIANEIVSQSRNVSAGSESDLAASFWRFVPYPDKQVSMNLEQACSQFYPVDGKRTTTAARLKDRVVIGSIDPNQGEEEFYLYPPYSEFELDKASRSGTLSSLPIARRFIYGWDWDNQGTSIEGIHKDGVFVLLGLPKTKINFCIIPEHLRNAYANLAKNLPFYVPAYSEAGKLLNTPK